MTRRLLASYAALTLLLLLVLELPLAFQFRRSERRDLSSRVERDAFVLGGLAEDTLERRAASAPRPLVEVAAGYAADTGGRVVVVGRRGLSLLDTDRPGGEPRDFSSRPEIAAALLGRTSSGIRHSDTLGKSFLYVAVPVASGGAVHGAVRITYPTSTLDARVHRYWLMLAAIAVVALAVAALAAVAFSRWIARPLIGVERAVETAGRGDLTARAATEGPPEIRALAATFNTMIAKLQSLLDSQQAFVADASHQLRTPLTALRLRLENLEAAADTPGIEAALREVARLSRLVDGLLALARADAPAEPPEAVQLAAVVSARVDAWNALAAERSVDLRGDVEPGLAVRATADALEQILDNVLANALEVAPPGTAVEIIASRRADWVELRILDRGPGLDDESRARAFDRFWQAGGAGSGLGLAIVQRLASAMGGDAALRPRPDGGLEAVVRLRAAGSAGDQRIH